MCKCVWVQRQTFEQMSANILYINMDCRWQCHIQRSRKKESLKFAYRADRAARGSKARHAEILHSVQLTRDPV